VYTSRKVFNLTLITQITADLDTVFGLRISVFVLGIAEGGGF
jgi:hypothetical protein